MDAWSPCSASCGEGMRFRNVECKIFMEFSKTVATLPDKVNTKYIMRDFILLTLR